MIISPFLTVDHTCDETLQWAGQQLSQAGLRLVQTFDLHAARAGLQDCPCPNHGLQACDCQMLVLLVYGKAPRPETLILHGNDGQTWLSLAEAPDQEQDSEVLSAIRNILEGNPPG